MSGIALIPFYAYLERLHPAAPLGFILFACAALLALMHWLRDDHLVGGAFFMGNMKLGGGFLLVMAIFLNIFETTRPWASVLAEAVAMAALALLALGAVVMVALMCVELMKRVCKLRPHR